MLGERKSDRGQSVKECLHYIVREKDECGEVISQKPREERLEKCGQQFWRSGRVQGMPFYHKDDLSIFIDRTGANR